MSERIKKDGFHVIFNENKQQNIDTAKSLDALNVYSGHLDDIKNDMINTSEYKYLLATTVMSEGVSLNLDILQTVYVHITKATDASLAIQMASRIRNATKIKVLIYTTENMYKNDTPKELQINMSYMESSLKKLKNYWEDRDSDNKHISHSKIIMDKQTNKYARSTNAKTKSTSYFNLFSLTREYEKKLERNSLQYFIDSIKEFTKCKIKVKNDNNKTSIIVKNKYDKLDDLEQLKECAELGKEEFDLLPMIQQKQVIRYREIEVLLSERSSFSEKIIITDIEKLELTLTELNLTVFKRHIKLLDSGVYHYLKSERVFKHFKKGIEIAENRLIKLSKRLVQRAQFVKVAKLPYKGQVDIDYIEVLNNLIQIRPMLTGNYIITSYKLWGS